MKTSDVIIGAQFGDEGKGLVTDSLAAVHGPEAVVARFNGGAQAAHTVTCADGRRHVFHHIGSGSFTGASTFLSRFFVSNPLMYMKEYADLQALGATPRVTADPAGLVTTPYDMMINQMIEVHRGNSRHGSCGLGFGETIERSLHPEFILTVADMTGRDALRARLTHMRTEWVPGRLAQLGITDIPEEWKKRLSSDGVLEAALDAFDFFRAHTETRDVSALKSARHVVFEGAQGLLLDQAHKWFPHVTRSNTGLKNVLVLAAGAGIENLDVTYVTRSYLTRHGAGPLPHELPCLPYPRIVDKTNVPNIHQGALRFAFLDMDLLRESITVDLGHRTSSVSVHPHLTVTCMDQIDGELTYMEGDEKRRLSPEAFLARAQERTGAQTLSCSDGPTRGHLTRALARPG